VIERGVSDASATTIWRWQHDRSLKPWQEAKTGIEPFGRLVEQVMSTEPYTSAKTVFWIVDNGSSHAGQRSIARKDPRPGLPRLDRVVVQPAPDRRR
jgi:hypothetical protein